MKTITIAIFALLSVASLTAADTKTPTAAAAPILTAEQKMQVKDFQIADSNLQVEILNSQKRQQENQQRAQAYISTLCKSTDGKQYELQFPQLSCALVSTKAK